MDGDCGDVENELEEVGFSPFNAESAVTGAKGGRYKLDSLVAQGRTCILDLYRTGHKDIASSIDRKV